MQAVAERRPDLVSSRLFLRKDSADFVKKLNDPDFEGRRFLHDRILGALTTKIDTLLLAQHSSTIQFSAQPHTVDPYIFRFQPDRSDNNGRYVLQNSARFWKMLEASPESLSIDCLNVIPILIVGAMRDVLIERGYAQAEVDQKLNGMIIHGRNTELTLGGEQVRPLSRTDTADSKGYRSFSHSKKPLGIVISAYGRLWGIDPDGMHVGTEVNAGDIFYFSTTRRSDLDFENWHSQNGIILESAPPKSLGSDIPVFTHFPRVKDRRMSLTEVLGIVAENGKPDMTTVREHVNNGGVGAEIDEFDYVGFYAAFAKDLLQTQ